MIVQLFIDFEESDIVFGLDYIKVDLTYTFGDVNIGCFIQAILQAYNSLNFLKTIELLMNY
jgi:hypothetical protein